jgi:uncharacterized protein with GYD domain
VPTYILLANWTDQGIRSFAGTVDRSEAAAKAFEAVGGRLKDIYWTMGP